MWSWQGSPKAVPDGDVQLEVTAGSGVWNDKGIFRVLKGGQLVQVKYVLYRIHWTHPAPAHFPTHSD